MEPSSIRQAIECLKDLGFPLSSIRKALHKLTGVSQPDMARQLNVSRPCITTHIDGRRHNHEVQRAIADIWGVTREDLFEMPPDNAGRI